MGLIRCIYVDDENTLDATFDAWVDAHRVDCAKSVLASSSRCPDPHLILADINMDQAQDGHSRVQWGTESMPLYGLTLALPFLGRGGPSAFQTYTSYGDEALQDGHVLVALTLIRSYVEQRGYSLSEMHALLQDEQTRDEHLPGVLKSALRRALAAFRTRLNVDFVEIEDLSSRLRNLIDASAFPIPIPLRDDLGPLRVMWAESNTIQAIDLHSLFADNLGFLPPATPKAFEEILKTLDTWAPRSTNNLSGLLECVASILNTPSGEGFTLPVTKKNLTDHASYVTNAPPVERKARMYQLLRLTMLCAWVQAWHTRAYEADRRSALRSDEESGDASTLKSLVFDLLHFSQKRDTTKLYNQLLCDTRKSTLTPFVDVADPYYRFRRPFNNWYRQTAGNRCAASYSLDSDEPACLSDLERYLVCEYAERYLDWPGYGHGQHAEWPSWMTEEEDSKAVRD